MSEDVYQQEQRERANRPRGSTGGGDFQWLNIDKPAATGDKTRKRLRVVQRLHWVDDGSGKRPNPEAPYPRFWIKANMHKYRVQGQFKTLVCPEDQKVEGWRDRATCPVCVLQRELWAAKRDDWDVLGKAIGAKLRVFCNCIDLDNVPKHWKEDGQGGWRIHPMIYGYSGTVHDFMVDFCITLGAIEDVQTGRNLVLTTERTGPLAWDISYRLINDDRSPLDHQLVPVAQGAYDLLGLAKPATEENLRAFAAALDPRTAVGGHQQYRPPAQPQEYAPPQQQAQPYQPQGQPPAPPQHAPPPPSPPQAVPPPGTAAVQYHYSGPSGQRQGVSAVEIAQLVLQDANAHHNVWTEGMASWVPGHEVQEITNWVAELQKPRDTYAPQGGYPVGGGSPPPGPPGGPPSPSPGDPPAPPMGVDQPGPPGGRQQPGQQPQAGPPVPPGQAPGPPGGTAF